MGVLEKSVDVADFGVCNHTRRLPVDGSSQLAYARIPRQRRLGRCRVGLEQCGSQFLDRLTRCRGCDRRMVGGGESTLPPKVRIWVCLGEPLPLVVADADAPWLTAAGRWHVRGKWSDVGVCRQFGAGGRRARAEFARAHALGTPRQTGGQIIDPSGGALCERRGSVVLINSRPRSGSC